MPCPSHWLPANRFVVSIWSVRGQSGLQASTFAFTSMGPTNISHDKHIVNIIYGPLGVSGKCRRVISQETLIRCD